MNQFRNKLVEALGIKTLIIVILVIIIPNMIMILTSNHQSIDSWKEYAQETRIMYTNLIDEEAMEENIVFANGIKVIDYSLEHNIPYGVRSSWSQVKDMASMSILVTMIIIFLTGKVYMCENKSDIDKNIDCAQVSRKKIFRNEMLFCYIQAFLIILVFFIINLIIGSIAYGVSDNLIEIKLVGNQIVESNIITKIICSYTLLLMKSIFYISIILLLINTLKERKIALCIPIILEVFGGIINIFFEKIYLDKLLPFKYISISAVSSFGELLLATLVFIIYSTIFVFYLEKKFVKLNI